MVIYDEYASPTFLCHPVHNLKWLKKFFTKLIQSSWLHISSHRGWDDLINRPTHLPGVKKTINETSHTTSSSQFSNYICNGLTLEMLFKSSVNKNYRQRKIFLSPRHCEATQTTAIIDFATVVLLKWVSQYKFFLFIRNIHHSYPHQVPPAYPRVCIKLELYSCVHVLLWPRLYASSAFWIGIIIISLYIIMKYTTI